MQSPSRSKYAVECGMESPTSTGFRQSVSAALYFSVKEIDFLSEILYTLTFPLSTSLYRISFLLLASLGREKELT